MMCRKYLYQLIGKLSRCFRVAVGQMGDEVDELAEGYNAGISCRRRCLKEDFFLAAILAILCFEFRLIRAWVPSNFILQIGTEHFQQNASYHQHWRLTDRRRLSPELQASFYPSCRWSLECSRKVSHQYSTCYRWGVHQNRYLIVGSRANLCGKQRLGGNCGNGPAQLLTTSTIFASLFVMQEGVT